jgi:hypothetical protein
MSNRYLKPSPLPFENDVALTLFAEERPSIDVVESPAPHRAGFHSDLDVRTARPRGFVAPTLFDVTGHLLGPALNDDDEANDTGDRGGQGDQDHRNDPDHREYVVSREELLQRDHDDRETCRTDTERERELDERRTLRHIRAGLRVRRRAAPRSRKLDLVRERADIANAQLRGRHQSGHRPSSGGLEPELSTGDRFHLGRDVHVAAHSQRLKRVVAPLQGSALAVYFVLLPYVVVSKWHRTQRQNDGTLVRALLIALALFWLAFLFQVARDVWRLRRGATAGTGGSAWLAAGVVTLLAFVIPTSAGAATSVAPAPHSVVVGAHSSSSRPSPTKSPIRIPDPLSATLGAMPLALMAKRRSDLIRQHQFVDIDDDVEESIELLRSLNPTLLGQLRHMIGERLDGVIDVPNDIDSTAPSRECTDAYVACALAPSPHGTLVSYAREGGVLAIHPTWSSRDVVEATVALHNGRLVYADNENELLRALATRSVRHALVVYLGERAELDDELIACSITLTPYREQPRALRTSAWSSVAAQSGHGGIRVELLRAEVHVTGLCEPLTPTLRRRGIEMLAYLAMHRHEPITGERLRTRVLTHADVDASLRTLANTASVVRRSAGSDDQGPRLHAVTSSGLYVTHGVTSDVEVFTTLISRARELTTGEAAPLAHQALAMVKGEPLASALRGFEWFLAEGFSARLSRDGEWAALALHHDALENGRYELAFWALQQGLLIDPYSDVLLEASARVPRLREFGRDVRSVTQHDAVGPGRAVSMSWSLNGFSNQVTK